MKRTPFRLCAFVALAITSLPSVGECWGEIGAGGSWGEIGAGSIAWNDDKPNMDSRPTASFDGGLLDLSTYLGGSGDDFANCQSLDAEGNLIVGGRTASPDFPVTFGAYDTDPNGMNDAFIAKLDAGGRKLIWCTYLGGSAGDELLALTVAPSGALILGGLTASADFPTTPGCFDGSHNGSTDVFIAELDAGGGELHWSTYLGGSQIDMLRPHLVLDARGNITMTGYTASANFPATPGAWDLSHGGGLFDGFVAKLDASGSRLHWSSFLGGSQADKAYALAMDPEQNLLVAGVTRSADFPVSPGAFDTSLGGGGDAFLVKLSSDGARLIWGSFLGGDDMSSSEETYALALDDGGNPIVAGATSAADFPVTSGAFDCSHNGATDGFASKLDAAGSRLLWSSFLGGQGEDAIHALAIDEDGRLSVAGVSGSLDYPTTEDAFSRAHAGGETDVILSRLDASGTHLIWSSYLGGKADDIPFALALAGADALFVTGLTGMTLEDPFPTTPGAFDETLNGMNDAFLSRFALPSPSGVRVGSGASRVPRLVAEPNPFGAFTTIRYDLPQAGRATLIVYDLSGRRLKTLAHDDDCRAGAHAVLWDGKDASGERQAAGIYLVRLETAHAPLDRKLIVIR